MKSDLEILTRATNFENFFQSVLLEDALEDWCLAKELGELLVRGNRGPDFPGGPLAGSDPHSRGTLPLRGKSKRERRYFAFLALTYTSCHT